MELQIVDSPAKLAHAVIIECGRRRSNPFVKCQGMVCQLTEGKKKKKLVMSCVFLLRT